MLIRSTLRILELLLSMVHTWTMAIVADISNTLCPIAPRHHPS
jgi:hypothetical protein